VVRLAALGHSNVEIARALYLSPRTVGWHLSNAFRKLGLTSRTELAAEALRRAATALPLGFQLECAQRLSHFTLPYPDIPTWPGNGGYFRMHPRN
jgi:hypothetical protein